MCKALNQIPSSTRSQKVLLAGWAWSLPGSATVVVTPRLPVFSRRLASNSPWFPACSQLPPSFQQLPGCSQQLTASLGTLALVLYLRIWVLTQLVSWVHTDSLGESLLSQRHLEFWDIKMQGFCSPLLRGLSLKPLLRWLPSREPASELGALLWHLLGYRMHISYLNITFFFFENTRLCICVVF
jgi:hypothetical protein